MKLKKFLIETFVVLGALCLINFAFFRSNLGFLHVNPHPYWLPILFMASYYGVRAAFITSLLYSTVFLIFFLTTYAHAIETFWSLAVLGRPILFMIFGSLLGQISQTLKDSIEDWRRKYEIMKEDKEKGEDKLTTAVKAQKELENRLVTQITTISTIYDFAKKLETFNIKELYQTTLKTLIENFHIDQVSFYLADHNLLKLEATEFKDRQVFEPRKEINKTNGIFNIAITNNKTVSIRELFHELDFKILRESPMITAPLFRKTGVLIGVITVDKISFEHYTNTTVKLFSIVVEWLANAIDNALYLEETQKKNILNEDLGFYNYEYFKTRLKEEFDRSKRYALPLSLIFFRIKNYEKIKKGILPPLVKALSTILKESARDIDILSLYKWENTWALLFPIFPLKEAEAFKESIKSKIEEFNFEPYEDKSPLQIEMVISDFHPRLTSAEDLLVKGEKQLT